MTEKTAVATVKYKMYGKIDFEKKFETVKAAKGFFWGYVTKTPNITGELIINDENLKKAEKMYDKFYDDCLAKATKNMLPLGYAMFEIKAAAEDWAAEEMEKFAKCNYVGLNLKNVMNGLTETAE